MPSISIETLFHQLHDELSPLGREEASALFAVLKSLLVGIADPDSLQTSDFEAARSGEVDIVRLYQLAFQFEINVQHAISQELINIANSLAEAEEELALKLNLYRFQLGKSMTVEELNLLLSQAKAHVEQHRPNFDAVSLQLMELAISTIEKAILDRIPVAQSLSKNTTS